MENQQARKIKPKTPKRASPSIKKDAIHPADFNKYKLPWSCDDCAHFDFSGERCTLGYQSSHHRRAEQLKSYSVSGRMALCRFLEID